MFAYNLVSRTIPDWNQFLSFTKHTTGKSISNSIEMKKIDKNNPKLSTLAFHECLKELLDDIPVESLYNHIHYSFFFISTKDNLLELINHISNLNLNFTQTTQTDYVLAIGTGSLKDWRQFIYECSNGDEAIEIRELANRLLAFFESEGLYKLFSDFHRFDKDDGTLLLK